MRRVALYGTGVLILNAAANLLHGAFHMGQHVMSLEVWQWVYVTLVIGITPIAAAIVLLCTRCRDVGAWLLLASMVGSFVFGLAYHFLIPRPDNAFTLEPGAWQTTFRASAVFLLLIEGAGCLIEVWFLSRLARLPGAAGVMRPIGEIADSRPGPSARPR